MELFQDKNDWVENARIMSWRVRPGGRPKKTWREVVETDCPTQLLNKEVAIDCSEWRKLIRYCMYSCKDRE